MYTAGKDGRYSIPLVDFGKRLQKNFGLTVVEHPEFGGVTDVHAPNSYHKYGEAIDIQDWRDDEIDGVDWRTRTGNLRDMLRGAGPEVIGPGQKGHDSHVHLAATGGMLSLDENQYNYFFGGNAGGKNALFTGSVDPSTPSPAADVQAPPATVDTAEPTAPATDYSGMTKSQINAEYDKLRMAGDVFQAQDVGMKMHNAFFNK